jgi:ABC-type transporter Mla maintaining outer membrane lipid asymmetry permease subunit MlaE
MLLAAWIRVPPLLSLAVIAACIGAAVVSSVVAARRERSQMSDVCHRPRADVR